jgi:hypothetical protein
MPLELPRATGRVPALVIADASSGLTTAGPERDYAAVLSAAGVATLAIDMRIARRVPSGPAAFGHGGDDLRPRSLRDTLPDAFGALKFLSAIDPQRIELDSRLFVGAVLGAAMVEHVALRALGPSPRFAAHSALFIVCPVWTAAHMGLAKWTGAPLQLQVRTIRRASDDPTLARKRTSIEPPRLERRVAASWSAASRDR